MNAICWAPHSATHICSVGDDKQALIWDLSNHYEVHENPLLDTQVKSQYQIYAGHCCKTIGYQFATRNISKF